MPHLLNDVADDVAAEFCFIYLFGRDPDRDTIEAALSSERTIDQLRSDAIRSPEYQLRLQEHTRSVMLDQYLSCWAEKIDTTHHASDSVNQIILLQTSDPTNYKSMLQASAVFNKTYASLHGLIYQDYFGVKRGVYPHHAVFNRIHLLQDMISKDYTGWVLYVDADAIISRPDFDIVSHLGQLRSEGKCMSLHSVFPPEHPRHQWWDVNTGCFAVDLSSGRARTLIRAWAGIYNDLFSIKDYESANIWHGWIIDDQNTFWPALRQLDMRGHVNLENSQGEGGYVKQFYRHDASNVSPEEEVRRRTLDITAAGNIIYERYLQDSASSA